MASYDEESVFGAEPRKKQTVHEIGQNIEALSVHELDERIEMLKTEIARIETLRTAKEASRRAADAFFRG